MDYKQYENPEELRKLQIISTRVLEELDRVCQLLNIPYFIYAGTAIGALRHGGFIPWDDDIDVGFFRDDYERFLKEAPSVISGDFEINNGRLDDYFPACNSNLSLKGSLCVPEEFDRCEFQYRIGLGLYAFDKVSNDEAIRRKQLRGTWLWARVSFLLATPEPHVPFSGVAEKGVKLVCAIVHKILRLFRVSSKRVHEKWEHYATLAQGEESPLYADFTDRHPLSWTVTNAEVFPLRRIAFEDIEVNIPNDCDAMLRRGYGDYMAVPPERDRKNHYPSKLDFGKY